MPETDTVSGEVRDLIRRMSLANRLWGAPRIHGELMKLGIQVCKQPSRSIWSGTGSRRRRVGGHFWTTTYRIRCETYLALLTYLFHVDPMEDVSGFFHLLLRGEAAAVMEHLRKMESCLPRRFAASVAASVWICSAASVGCGG